MLIVFSGGSGVGKNTVIAQLLKSGDYVLMPTYTTRDKRDGESEGNPYHFLTDGEFLKKIDEGDFYEYQRVHNHYYGTSKTLLKNALATGKILLKDIDVIGTQNLLTAIGGSTKVLTVFLKVDSPEILRQRLIGRGEKDIELRLQRYGLEQQYAVNYDYVVNNESLEKTVGILNAVFAYEKTGLPLHGTLQGGISEEKVRALAEKLKKGEKLPPIYVALRGGEPYILDGHHRYLASLLSGCRLAKEIVPNEDAKSADGAKWQNAVEKYSRR